MDALQELVRSLATVIILTSFLEMLLPNSKMKNYTRLILGLFVIVIILNPVLAFLGSPDAFSAQAWVPSSQEQDMDNILKDAQELSGKAQDSAVKEYSAKVEQQIAALVRLSPEISHAEVEVELRESVSSEALGALEKVAITAHIKALEPESGMASESDLKVSAIEPVTQEEKNAQEQIERRLQSIVSDFYGLMPDQVSVKLED